MTISVLMHKPKSAYFTFLRKEFIGMIISLIGFSSCFQANPPAENHSANPYKHYYHPVKRGYSRENNSASQNTTQTIPEKAIQVLAYIEQHGEPMPGYVGGRKFGNFEKRLPTSDEKGNPISYQEWDINPHEKGVNRGAERLITSSNHKAYFTQDHYQTFTEVSIP